MVSDQSDVEKQKELRALRDRILADQDKSDFQAKMSTRWVLTSFAAIMVVGLIVLIEKGVSRRDDALKDTASSASFEDRCVLSWSGSVKSFENVVKTALGNPKGFAVVRTGFGNTQGRIVIMTMEYTLTNEYGGTLKGKAMGQIDSTTCQTVALDAI